VTVFGCLLRVAICRTKVSTLLLPRLKQFQADLLIISSGFDAHHEDLYHFLDDSSIHWLTSQLCKCVEETGGRVVSILEGGYSLEQVSAPAPAHSKQAKAKAKTSATAAALVSPSSSSDATAGTEDVPTVRANRGKNKKYEDTGSSATAAAAASKSPGSVSLSAAGQSAVDPDTAFAQQAGDGGLVRG
jgi:hypothetical protein